MACCCHQLCERDPCNAYGNDCCTLKQQEPPKRKTMFEIQGIFPARQPPNLAPEGNYRFPVRQFWHPPAFVRPEIPSIIISEDTSGPFLSNFDPCEGKRVRNALWMTDTKFCEANRGPKLRIQGRITDGVLTYKEFQKLDKNGIPVEPKPQDCSGLYPSVEDLFLSEELGPFAATTMCKQELCVTLENEGTVAIRYLWLRSPPTRVMGRILARPGNILNIQKLQAPQDEPFFWKDDNFEFNFRGLPGVILPGQSIKFPVIFRPRCNGYFYENLYLLTHPRLSSDDDCIFKMRLTGICMDPDCPLLPSEATKFSKSTRAPEKLSRKFRSKMLYNEASDCLDSMLDTILYDSTEQRSTLPLGKITAEQIFYTHNRDMHYTYQVAEAALENVRELVKNLVPKNKIIDNENTCPLSIQSLYAQIAIAPTPTEYFWNKFKSLKTEESLEELSKQTRQLFKPRVFSWPSIKTRLHSSCYTTMVSSIDEVVAKITNIDFDLNNQNMDKVLRKEIRNRLTKKKQKEQRRQERRAERLGRNLNQKPSGKGNPYETRKDRGDTYETEGEFLDAEDDGESYNVRPSIFIAEEEITAELMELKKGTENKSKQILFETLFGCSVERMMSVVDSYRVMYDYKQPAGPRKCAASSCYKQ